MMGDEPLATASEPCPTASEPLRHRASEPCPTASESMPHCLRATRHSPPPPSHAPPLVRPPPSHRRTQSSHQLSSRHHPMDPVLAPQSTVLQRGGLGISFVFLGIAPVALVAGRPRRQPGEGPGGFYAGLRALALTLALRDLTTMRGCVLAPRRGVSTLEDRVRGSSTEKRLGKQGHWWCCHCHRLRG